MQTPNILLSVWQVLLALVAFACAVLASPHWREYYDNRREFERVGLPIRYYGRPVDDRVIFVVEDNRRL